MKVGLKEKRKRNLIAVKKYQSKNVEKVRERYRKYQLAHREYYSKTSVEWAKKNRDKKRQSVRNWYKRVREDVLNHYGNCCACCGENRKVFLAIDHINGGGNKHRKSLKTTNLAHWVQKNNYPKEYRILCHNCNYAITIGICPHKQK